MAQHSSIFKDRCIPIEDSTLSVKTAGIPTRPCTYLFARFWQNDFSALTYILRFINTNAANVLVGFRSIFRTLARYLQPYEPIFDSSFLNRSASINILYLDVHAQTRTASNMYNVNNLNITV